MFHVKHLCGLFAGKPFTLARAARVWATSTFAAGSMCIIEGLYTRAGFASPNT